MKAIILPFTALLIVVAIMFASCQSDADINLQRYYTAGQLVYQSHCQNCHGTAGEGLGQLMPPLSDSPYLKQNLAMLPCVIKNGLQGEVSIHSKSYNQPMPAQTDLSPIEIAQVLTYVNNSFGNKLGLIDEPKVTADLGQCR